jgi:hypothetical protein
MRHLKMFQSRASSLKNSRMALLPQLNWMRMAFHPERPDLREKSRFADQMRERKPAYLTPKRPWISSTSWASSLKTRS